MMRLWVLTLYVAVPGKPDYKVDHLGPYDTAQQCERASRETAFHRDSDGQRVVVRVCDAQWFTVRPL